MNFLKWAFCIIFTQNSGERGKVRLIRTSKSIDEGAIDETKNRYDKAAAGRSPMEIMKEALKWIALPCLLALDIGSKIGAIAWIPPLSHFIRSYPFGGIGIFNISAVTFSLNIIGNTGAACGLFPGHPGALFWLRLAIIAGLIAYLIFFKKISQGIWPLWIVVTGAIGNAIDYGLYGHVIDFFHFTFWGRSFPIFNFADSYITLGVFFLLFCGSLKKLPRTGTV